MHLVETMLGIFFIIKIVPWLESKSVKTIPGRKLQPSRAQGLAEVPGDRVAQRSPDPGSLHILAAPGLRLSDACHPLSVTCHNGLWNKQRFHSPLSSCCQFMLLFRLFYVIRVQREEPAWCTDAPDLAAGGHFGARLRSAKEGARAKP